MHKYLYVKQYRIYTTEGVKTRCYKDTNGNDCLRVVFEQDLKDQFVRMPSTGKYRAFCSWIFFL